MDLWLCLTDPEVLRDGILYYFERNLMVKGIEDEEEVSFLNFFDLMEVKNTTFRFI